MAAPLSLGMARSKPTDPTAPSGKAGRGPKDGGRGRTAGVRVHRLRQGAQAGQEGPAEGRRLKKFSGQPRMIKQAYTLTREERPEAPLDHADRLRGGRGVVELLGILFSSPFLFLPLAIITGALAALVIFGRRAQGSAYRQVEGQPGAAAWVLEGMRGDWRVSAGVARTTQLDAVHRVLGRPG